MENTIEIFVDGAVSGNGTAESHGASSIVVPSMGLEFGKYFPSVTNNEVEYKAVIGAANLAVQRGWEDIIIYTDSQLVAMQVTGTWKVREPRLQPMCELAKKFLAQIPKWKLAHIPGHGKCTIEKLREGNDRADAIAVEYKERGMGKCS